MPNTVDRIARIDSLASSRRKFFTASAMLFGAGAVAVNLEGQTAIPTDVDILNFALRLERLEATFYSLGLARFSATDFAAANFASGMTTAQVNRIYGLFQAIAAHEQTHVMQISGLVTKLNGTPAAPDCYAFAPGGTDVNTFKTVDNFVNVAMTLENTGVSAYDGAIAFVQSADLRIAAATIATVEARHASYLNNLLGKSPFPAPFDTPATLSDVLTAAGAFISSCASFPPTAVANPKNLTTSLKTFTLDATSSTAADGGPLSYQWETVLGSNATVTNPSSPKPTVTFNGGPGVYAFTLMVMDGRGLNGTETLKVTYTGGS